MTSNVDVRGINVSYCTLPRMQNVSRCCLVLNENTTSFSGCNSCRDHFCLLRVNYYEIIETAVMPIALSPSEALPLPRWERPAKTSHDLPWAEIKVLDLSTFDLPGGKQKLAEELRDAVCIYMTAIQ